MCPSFTSWTRPRVLLDLDTLYTEDNDVWPNTNWVLRSCFINLSIGLSWTFSSTIGIHGRVSLSRLTWIVRETIPKTGPSRSVTVSVGSREFASQQDLFFLLLYTGPNPVSILLVTHHLFPPTSHNSHLPTFWPPTTVRYQDTGIGPR